jgi:hypothetical protein
MSVSLYSYPVETIDGIVENVFSGFNKIELIFTNDVNPGDQSTINVVGIEAVIVDPDDDSIDMLGFSLYSDFGLDVLGDLSGVIFKYFATIDVSIINDLLSQFPNFEQGEFEESRIKFRIKYRPVYDDGTIDSFIFLSGEYPIICHYSLVTPGLDSFIGMQNSPKIWRGYPLMSGLIHSDENYGDITITFDTFDISESLLNSGTKIIFSGSDIGSLLLDLSLLQDSTTPVIPNAGYSNTTDWDPNTGGTADDWETLNGTGSIVTGNGFTGNAQRCDTDSIAAPTIRLQAINRVSVPNGNATLFFKYRATNGVVYRFDWVGGTSEVLLAENLGNAIQASEAITITLGYVCPYFYAPGSVATWIEIDEVYVVIEGTSEEIPIDVKFVDYKIEA